MSSTWRDTLTVLVGAGCIALAGCSSSNSEEMAGEESSRIVPVTSEAGSGAPRVSTPVPTEKPKGRSAPEFNLTLLDGSSVQLSDFQGKVLLIDFWATWCGPCRMSIPHLIELQEELGQEGFAILGVSLDRTGVDAVRRFVESAEINYAIAMGTPGIVRAYGGPQGIRGIPIAFLVDRDGQLANVIQGYRPKPYYEGLIRPLLGLDES